MRKQDNNSTMVIAVLCAVIIVIFSIVAVMLGKSHSGSGTNVMTKGSDPLPEGSDGNWWVPADSHVLQSPRNADMSEDAALADELDFGVVMDYTTYKTNRVGEVSSPLYKVKENCGAGAMDKVGMQSDGIMDEYSDGASVTQIEVYDTQGKQLCDTVFIVDGQYLIYYGTGNFVFEAVKMEAVG